VVLITHDRSLMEMVADRLWLTSDGTIQPFDGDMEDYARLVLERARSGARPGAATKPAPIPVRRTAVASGPLRRRLDAAEAELARESAALAEIESALSDPSLYINRAGEIVRLTERRDRLSDRVRRAEAAWLEAAEAYEGASGT
jgi:ATP-binding cassette subfamily F protein 3